MLNVRPLYEKSISTTMKASNNWRRKDMANSVEIRNKFQDRSSKISFIDSYFRAWRFFL